MTVKMKHRDDKYYDVMMYRGDKWTATVCDPFEAARILKPYVDRVFNTKKAKRPTAVYEILKLAIDETIVFDVDDQIYYEVLGRKGV